ncbi:MAG: PDZ domain-containing protein [Epsilonproteobacteria bacterium]|nr:PDZ domain-containing protein [Campylobacterota bacterium]
MLFRLFALTTLLFLNLYACKGGYASCVAKVKDSHAIQNSSLFIPISKTTRLVYAQNKPHAKILKQDPFLSLYLVEDKHPFAYPFDINMRLQLGTAMVTDKLAKEGKFVRNQVGLNTLAKYSEKLIYPALLTSSCCSLEGIVTQRGIIQKEYLNHFVVSKSSDYGDIGIRVKNEKGLVVVSASDPFMKNNPFKKGDCIIAFDGKKIQAASVLMRKILFSKVGSKHSVKVKRDNKFITYKVTTQKRFGGGALSDTFLEKKGLFFDEQLHLKKIASIFTKYGLKIGDKLIQINGVGVKNQKELRVYLQKYKDYSSLLFERNGFQFFVNIK